MLAHRDDGRVDATCDRCLAMVTAADEATLRAIGWQDAAPPGLSGRILCQACVGKPMALPRRGKRSRR